MSGEQSVSQPTHQPRYQECWRCDFASGYRAMDRCHVCDGTGMIYTFASDRPKDQGARIFPGTPEGKRAAVQAKYRQMVRAGWGHEAAEAVAYPLGAGLTQGEIAAAIAEARAETATE